MWGHKAGKFAAKQKTSILIFRRELLDIYQFMFFAESQLPQKIVVRKLFQ